MHLEFVISAKIVGRIRNQWFNGFFVTIIIKSIAKLISIAIGWIIIVVIIIRTMVATKAAIR